MPVVHDLQRTWGGVLDPWACYGLRKIHSPEGHVRIPQTTRPQKHHGANHLEDRHGRILLILSNGFWNARRPRMTTTVSARSGGNSTKSAICVTREDGSTQYISISAGVVTTSRVGSLLPLSLTSKDAPMLKGRRCKVAQMGQSVFRENSFRSLRIDWLLPHPGKIFMRQTIW
jgi:VCBS repeat-containing protein